MIGRRRLKRGGESKLAGKEVGEKMCRIPKQTLRAYREGGKRGIERKSKGEQGWYST